ncbi:hypothetical protein M514_22629 [Trichuris suis]|uniref:Uncharacterized protein n=1 Tax=Trichuris suis TaxID=68888 RepID=A0A085N6Q8_9BILA|nr:hypothetical protein M514_22629 [Trichuris suis]
MAQRGGSYACPVRPAVIQQPFSGEQEWTEFLETSEYRSDINKWTDREKLTWSRLSLIGDSAWVYRQRRLLEGHNQHNKDLNTRFALESCHSDGTAARTRREVRTVSQAGTYGCPSALQSNQRPGYRMPLTRRFPAAEQVCT